MQYYKLFFGVMLPLTSIILCVDGIFFRRKAVVPPKPIDSDTRQSAKIDPLAMADPKIPQTAGFYPNSNFNNPLTNKKRQQKHDFLTKTERKILEAQAEAQQATRLEMKAVYIPHKEKLAAAYQKVDEYQLAEAMKIRKYEEKIRGMERLEKQYKVFDYADEIADSRRRIKNLEDLRARKVWKPLLKDYTNHLNFEKHKAMLPIYEKQRNFPKMRKYQKKYEKEQRAFDKKNPNLHIQQWPAARARNAPQWLVQSTPVKPQYSAEALAYKRGLRMPRIYSNPLVLPADLLQGEG